MFCLLDTRVEGFGSVIVTDRHRLLERIGPVSMPESTRWTVHPVTFYPYSRACFQAFNPGKAGSNAGWMFTTRSWKAVRKGALRMRMKPANTTISTLTFCNRPM